MLTFQIGLLAMAWGCAGGWGDDYESDFAEGTWQQGNSSASSAPAWDEPIWDEKSDPKTWDWSFDFLKDESSWTSWKPQKKQL